MYWQPLTRPRWPGGKSRRPRQWARSSLWPHRRGPDRVPQDSSIPMLVSAIESSVCPFICASTIPSAIGKQNGPGFFEGGHFFETSAIPANPHHHRLPGRSRMSYTETDEPSPRRPGSGHSCSGCCQCTECRPRGWVSNHMIQTFPANHDSEL